LLAVQEFDNDDVALAMAEFDRLTALNAQLLESCKDLFALVMEHGSPAMKAHATRLREDYAAIRAAEEAGDAVKVAELQEAAKRAGEAVGGVGQFLRGSTAANRRGDRIA
jgi:hypothetical protein